MVETYMEKGDNSEQLIRRFLKRIKKSRIIEECIDRRFYEKPSVKKRKAKQRAIAARKKEEAKLAQDYLE
jgi:ribosomal protein S21